MNSDTINVRTNLFLWLLTGRSRNFFNETLNTGISYSAGRTPSEVEHLRKILKLDDTRTDFYVLGALGAAYMSTSILRTMVNESQAVFVSGLLSLPGVQSTHTLLPTDKLSWPSVAGSAAGRDGFILVSAEYKDADKVTITTDAGGSRQATYSVTAEDSGSRLSIPALADYGVRADFAVSSWGPGDRVTVRMSPTRYPFRSMAEKLATDSVAIRVMNEEGTLQAFSETFSPARKVGLAALAVIRRMLRVVNDTQYGFTFSVYFDGESPEPLQKKFAIDPDMIPGLLVATEVDPEEPQGFNA